MKNNNFKCEAENTVFKCSFGEINLKNNNENDFIQLDENDIKEIQRIIKIADNDIRTMNNVI